MSLQNVLAEIKTLKPFAEEDVNSGPSETLNGRRGRKSQAIETLKRLKRDYKKQMLDSAMFIISVGSGQNEVAKLAVEEFGLFVTSPETFYKDLSARVPPALYLNKKGTSNVFEVLGRHLEDKMMELDLDQYNQLIFKAEYAESISSADQLTALIQKAINSQIGSEIVGVQAVNSLIDEAIERGHQDNVTPIVLTTSDAKLAQDLVRDLNMVFPVGPNGQRPKRTFLLGTGDVDSQLKSVDGAFILEDTSKKTIKAALATMRKSLRK